MKVLKAFLMMSIGLMTVTMVSCQSEETSKQPEENKETQTTPAAKPEKPDADDTEVVSDTVRLTITGNDVMKFNKSKLKVKEGQVVVLTLKHVGKQPLESMGHNWVLLEKDVDMNAFGKAAVNARDTDYIPQDRKDQIIAHTEMLGGGESDTIIFDAPGKGTYKFLCSFPGHYAVMNGDFIVE